MLIPFDQLYTHFRLNISGILHIGAHECEELKDYMRFNISPLQIYWVEAQQSKVDQMKSNNVPNIYQAIIDEVDDKEISFNKIFVKIMFSCASSLVLNKI